MPGARRLQAPRQVRVSGRSRARNRARPVSGLELRWREEARAVKVRPSVKRICEKCKIIKRHGRVMVICENPKHKQAQG